MNKIYFTEFLLTKVLKLRQAKRITFIYLGMVFLFSSISTAYPQAGVPISTAPDSQFVPVIVSDGSGGAIIVWQDQRSGNWDIFAQRINAAGVVQWTTDGIPISTAADRQLSPDITSDSAGGAIITWFDLRTNPDIFAQRIDSAGVVQWTPDGLPISTDPNDQGQPTIVSDGSGGAIIAWQDQRSRNWDIFAQRINTTGLVQWSPDGVPISKAANDQIQPSMVSDQIGGAIITWEDLRGVDTDIFAQRIDSTGVTQWIADGVAISAAVNTQIRPVIASDDSGGAIIAWDDLRSNNLDVYAQRIDTSGAVQWTSDGVPISTAVNDQGEVRITIDGSGGAIITWEDGRTGIDDDVYAQRINAAGEVQWTPNGVAISKATEDQDTPNIVSDGAGGAIITWEDKRSSGDEDIFAQLIDATGIVQWQPDGVPISTAQNPQEEPTIASDGAGGAIITWQDLQSGIWDIYVEHVDATGMVQWFPTGIEILDMKIPKSYQLHQNFPNPFNPITMINYQLPMTNRLRLKVYDLLGREIATLVDRQLPAGIHEVLWDASHMSSGIYYYHIRAGDFQDVKKMILMK